ncbi:methyl-accepting chemotaxis protein [[Clostridium] polysaccharolyticum]|uniref:Methyl-accepting chemotaxis protein n=1 Tax=[Clostridium] polysaccharolyticum TaxID=29364 RepID=A0A1I0B8C6_9FIRM|nr:methyl-accepting chemotaxis protein [[Clostridium] polysaccharolyticum]SET02777.1 Methyl-accepting chemotaxis protein [[Clostridium] polysaccharolyticum]
MFHTEQDVFRRKNWLFLLSWGIVIATLELAFIVEYFTGKQDLAYVSVLSLIAIIPYILAHVYYKKTDGLGRKIADFGIIAYCVFVCVTFIHAFSISNVLFFVPFVICLQIYSNQKLNLRFTSIAFFEVIAVIVYWYTIKGWNSSVYVAVYETVIAVYALLILFSNISSKIMSQTNAWRLGKIEDQAANAEQKTSTIVEASNEVALQIQQIKESIDTNADLIDKMNSSMGEVKHGMEEVSNALSDQTQAAITIQKTVDQVAGLASELAVNSEQSKENVELSSQNIEQVKAITQQVTGDSILVNEQMKALVDKANKVRSVTDVIHEIASQTNLLALNASIEAARAGEAGKGFAVVADEIRSLADSTKDSIAQIEQILTELEESSRQADNRLASMLNGMEEQNTRINDTYNSLNQVTSSLLELMKDMANISAQMNVVQKETASVVESVNDMSGISKNVSATATEVYELSNSAKAESEKVSESAGIITESMENLTK